MTYLKCLFLFCLLIPALINGQELGFSTFSSHSGVHKNKTGYEFLYNLGETINEYESRPNAAAAQGVLNFNLDATSGSNTILQTRVFLDNNANGIKDDDDYYFGLGKLQVVGHACYNMNDEQGVSLYLAKDAYTFRFTQENEYYNYTTPKEVNIEVEEDDRYLSIDFGVVPTDVIVDAEIYLTSERFRCFRRISHTLTQVNTGTVKLEGTLYLKIDKRLDSLEFPRKPDVVINNYLVGWHICLLPLQKQTIIYYTDAPGVASPADVGVIYTTKAWYEFPDEKREQICFEQELRCSYDPNDKLVQPDRPDSLALLDTDLVYTIRFQNTGNDVADDVVVADTLDKNLDMSSFTYIESSHPKQLKILFNENDEHIVNFQFKNIFLPDSTTNEPGSNGHITYSIKTKETTPPNTIIENTAHIYFDFNPAIVTNTTSSTMVDTFPIPLEDVTTEISQIICRGEVFEGYEETGIYTDVFPSGKGYDSIRILDLHTLEGKFESETTTICEGESYKGYAQTGYYLDTITVGPCPSILELNLIVTEQVEIYEEVSLCDNEYFMGYKGSGLIVERHLSQYGCDSMHIVELIVTDAIRSSEDHEICQGTDYLGYNQSGTYEDIFSTADGCDSVRILNLTVLEKMESDFEIQICQGENYEGYTTEGVFEDNFTTSAGCDSIRSLTLKVLESPEATLNIEICVGEAYEGYTTEGTYQDVFNASNGCDSTRTLELTVLEATQEIIEAEICQGDTYLGYTETGIYEDVFQADNGCDSLRTIGLTVLEQKSNVIDQSVCEGESFMGYDNTGTYEERQTADNGCDSIVIINLTVLTNSSTSKEVELCQGETYAGYAISGSYEDIFIAKNGCDSIRTLDLNVLPNSESHEQVHLCVAENYEGLKEAGLYTFKYENQFGCDSTRHLEIIKLERTDPICALPYDAIPKRMDQTDFLNVYPNPSADKVTLIIDKPERLPSELEIYDIRKRKVHRQLIELNSTEIDLSDFAQGVYVFILKNGSNLYIQRVIKS